MKTKMISVIALSACIIFTAASVEAKGCDKNKKCPVMKEACFLLKNQDDLALSDEQLTQIRILNADAQKDLIRKNAEIDVVKVDIKSQLWEETIDVAAIDELIDKKYDLKKAKAKASIKALADLRSILTDEQKETMGSLMCGSTKKYAAEEKGSMKGSRTMKKNK